MDAWRRKALEKKAEEQRNSPFNPERKVAELSDEVLMLLATVGSKDMPQDDKTGSGRD